MKLCAIVLVISSLLYLKSGTTSASSDIVGAQDALEQKLLAYSRTFQDADACGYKVVGALIGMCIEKTNDANKFAYTMDLKRCFEENRLKDCPETMRYLIEAAGSMEAGMLG
ncbi:uncharacterized protein LOC135385155 [Ornithodoros turicata]|uniref:uncharacterized protein LOC135385155 n=1 Tax=Ornithodoros turicata TaxID=34597 RepID=UPI0031395885